MNWKMMSDMILVEHCMKGTLQAKELAKRYASAMEELEELRKERQYNFRLCLSLAHRIEDILDYCDEHNYDIEELRPDLIRDRKNYLAWKERHNK